MADEEEYFRKIDEENKVKLRERLVAEQAIADREARRALHFFKCGKCGGNMTTEAFRGLAIEVCGDCGAVLLDAGELQTLAGTDSTDVFSSFFSMFGGRRS